MGAQQFNLSGNVIDEGLPLTLDFIDFCLSNDLQIDLKTGNYGKDLIIPHNQKINLDLITQVHTLYIDGKLYPAKYSEVFFKGGHRRIINATFRRLKLRTLSGKEMREVYGEEIAELSKQTNNLVYGADFSIQTDAIKEKRNITNSKKTPEEVAKSHEQRKETCCKRFGGPSPICDPEKLAKKNATMLKRYEKLSLAGEPWVQDNIKATNKENTGYEYNFQNPEFQENIKAANRENIGCDYPFQSPEFQAQIQANNLANIGHKSYAALPETREKIEATCLRKFEHRSPFGNRDIQLGIMNDKLSRTGKHCNFITGDGDFAFQWYLKLCEFRDQKAKGEINKEEAYEWIMSSDWNASYRLELLKELCDKQPTEYSTEMRIMNLLNELGLVEEHDFIHNAFKEHGVIFNKRYHDMDFFFPELKLGIEINGLAHHSVNVKTKGDLKSKDYHFNKFLRFWDNCILIITFTDDDLDNRWDSVVNVIKHHLIGEGIVDHTLADFPDLYQSLNYGLFSEECFREKLLQSRDFTNFVSAKRINQYEYWDCGKI